MALILGNLEEICTFQQMLVQSLEECTKLVPPLAHHRCSIRLTSSEHIQTQKYCRKATWKTNLMLLKSLLGYKDESGNSTRNLTCSTLTHSMYCMLFLSSGFCLSLLKSMSDVLFFRLPESQQRVGGFFLNLMPQMRALYNSYCSNHPSAVNVLTQHRYAYKIYYENLLAIRLFFFFLPVHSILIKYILFKFNYIHEII